MSEPDYFYLNLSPTLSSLLIKSLALAIDFRDYIDINSLGKPLIVLPTTKKPHQELVRLFVEAVRRF